MIRNNNRKALNYAVELWLSWLLATSIGISPAIIIAFISAMLSSFFITEHIYGGAEAWRLVLQLPLVGLPFILIGAIGLGYVQYRLLRTKINDPKRWFTITIIALGICLFVIWIGYWTFVDSRTASKCLIKFNIYWAGSLVGLILSLTQWSIIQDEIRGAGWWILSSFAGWTIGAYVISSAIRSYPIASIILGVISLCSITGLGYSYLFDQSHKRLSNLTAIIGIHLMVILVGGVVFRLYFSQQKLTLKGHSNHIEKIDFAPDGTQLASGSWDGSVRIWDTSSGNEEHIFRGDLIGVRSVDFSPDGQYLAAGGCHKGRNATLGGCDIGKIILWRVGTWEQVDQLEGGSSVLDLIFSPDGGSLAANIYTEDGSVIVIYDVSTWEVIQRIQGRKSDLTFSPDGKFLATSGTDYAAHIWDVRMGDKEYQLLGPGDFTHFAKFSPLGNILVTGYGELGVITIWDIHTGDLIKRLWGRGGDFIIGAISPDGRWLASETENNEIIIWDLSSGDRNKTFKGHTAFISTLAFSPDGLTLASGSWDNTIRIWDVSSLP